MNTAKSVLNSILEVFLPRSLAEKKCLSLTYEKLEQMISKDVRALTRDYTTALFDYRNQLIKTMIWMLKYRKNDEIAEKFGAALEQYLIDTMSDRILFDDFKDPVLIPVPLSRARERERGYNQVVLVTSCLHKINPGLCKMDTTSLVRVKNTLSQAKTSSKDERELNLADAFEVKDKARIKDRNVILLDDVITTGYTMEEARSVLLQSGANQVWCIALAH